VSLGAAGGLLVLSPAVVSPAWLSPALLSGVPMTVGSDPPPGLDDDRLPWCEAEATLSLPHRSRIS
jgi:hypothetical protein